MNPIEGGKPDPTVRMPKLGENLMSEHTRLGTPNLDYRSLSINLLADMSKAKAPAGKYEVLIEYLRQRTGGDANLDAAEIDRRMRTWFEDIITEILKNPSSWDQEKALLGTALMDYLAGAKGPGGAPQPQAPGGAPQIPGGEGPAK